MMSSQTTPTVPHPPADRPPLLHIAVEFEGEVTVRIDADRQGQEARLRAWLAPVETRALVVARIIADLEKLVEAPRP